MENNKMDTVYVIYFDGEMYREHNRKVAYLELKNAKQVITNDSKEIAKDMARLDRKYFYELTNEEEKEYIQKARKRFEIREFVERK
jgi:hypothetical protein